MIDACYPFRSNDTPHETEVPASSRRCIRMDLNLEWRWSAVTVSGGGRR